MKNYSTQKVGYNLPGGGGQIRDRKKYPGVDDYNPSATQVHPSQDRISKGSQTILVDIKYFNLATMYKRITRKSQLLLLLPS